ncbi:hypothetical protein Tco_0367361 [Tanacetum coccineum]
MKLSCAKGTRAELSSQITNDLATNVPPHVDAFLRNYMNNYILHMHPMSSSSSIPDLQHQLTNVFHRQDHDDDALPEGESSAKRQKTSDKGKSVVSDLSLKATEGSSQTKSSPYQTQQEYDPWSEEQGTDDDEKLMESALDNMMRIRCTSSEEYAYHLDHIKSYMENQILEKRSDPDKVYSDKKIVEVIRIQLQVLKQNDIEDLYLMCLNGKINYRENGIIKSLDVFIGSSVIWERVHDYQLGLESYQLKVNLIAPTHTVPGIEDLSPYSIIALPIIGLVCENSKNERRVMDINEIPKFCDAALKRVLENVKKINLDVKHGYKDPPLSKEDAKLMKFYEEHIQEWLKHRDQMKRWESYVNGRPIQNLRERSE